MLNKIYNEIFKKSPWGDFEGQGNIFTRKRKNQFNFDKKTILIVFIGLTLLWFCSGFYKVQEGEQAAVIQFGRFDRIGFPGLNYHLPYPIENKIVEKVNHSRRIEIGYRSSGKTRIENMQSSSRDINSESIMLTGDENIVELNVDVMWHISDLSHYIFNVLNPHDTVKAASESAIREVIGNTPISSVLSNEKQIITERIEKSIQQILNQYNTGVEIEQVQLLKAEPPKEVIQAYRDVQTAKADKEKEINQAQSYSNDIIPRARGEAAKILEGAEGYKAEVIARAEGDASRFNSIYSEYILGKEVTTSRLYLETIEKILQDSAKVIMGGEGILPHMSINQKNILNEQ